MKIFNASLNRRSFLKTSVAGAGLLAAPAIISSRALASSGELNFTGWAGYPGLAEKVFPAFTAKTGAQVFGVTEAEFAAATSANFDRLFRKAAQFEAAP